MERTEWADSDRDRAYCRGYPLSVRYLYYLGQSFCKGGVFLSTATVCEKMARVLPTSTCLWLPHYFQYALKLFSCQLLKEGAEEMKVGGSARLRVSINSFGIFDGNLAGSATLVWSAPLHSTRIGTIYSTALGRQRAVWATYTVSAFVEGIAVSLQQLPTDCCYKSFQGSCCYILFLS